MAPPEHVGFVYINMTHIRRNHSSFGHEELLIPRDLKDEGSDNIFNIFSNVAALLQVFEVNILQSVGSA